MVSLLFHLHLIQYRFILPFTPLLLVTLLVIMAAVSEVRPGLNVPMAVILLAGEMAGMGVLALPHAMIGTGPAGFGLILYFTLNAIFVGQRLGHCWVMVERMWPEFREEVRLVTSGYRHRLELSSAS